MKNVSGPEGSVFRKKGFFIALYSCLGVVVILAGVVAFANRSIYSPYDEPTVYVGADQVDSYLAQADEEAWFRPRQTPTPVPTPAPAPAPVPITPRPPQPHEHPEPPPAPPGANVPENVPEAYVPDDYVPVYAAGYEQLYSYDEPYAGYHTDIFTPFMADAGMIWPLYGEVVMPFSMTALVFDPTFDRFSTSDNMRLAAREGDPVRAGADGKVVAIGTDFMRGNYVRIDHGNGWKTTLGQLMPTALVSEGDIVRAGQVIGGVGQPSITGSLNGTHLHMHVTHNYQPMNPYELLHARSDTEY